MTENMDRKSKQAQFFDDMNLKKKYPHYIPIEVIRARERQKQDRANQNLVKADITKLTSGKSDLFCKRYLCSRLFLFDFGSLK